MSKKLFQTFRKRALFGASLFILLSLGIFFRHEILIKGVESFCHLACPIEEGWTFSYDSISLSRKGVRINALVLKANDGSFSYHCDQTRLYAKHIKGVHFDWHLDLPNSQVIFQEIEGAAPVSPDILWSILQKPMHLCIEEGEISLVKKSGVTQIAFSLYGEKSSSALGTFLLSGEKGGAPEAMVKCYGWPDEKIIKFEADACELSWLSAFLSYFSILDTSEWAIANGKLGGNLWLGWQGEKELSQLTARLRLAEFNASAEKHGLDLSIESMDFDLSFPSGKRLHEGIKWTPLQNLALTAEVHEGRIGFKDEVRGSEFAICDIGGVVCLNSLKHSEISLKGFLEQSGHLDPIVIAANPSLIDPNSLKLDLKLLLEPDHETKLGMSIAFEEGDRCILRGDLKEISTQQVSMFQHILGFAFPEIKDVEFAEGIVTCEMSLWLKKDKIEKLSLDELSCDNLQVYLRSQDIIGFCSHLGGSAEFDLSDLNNIGLPHWKLQLEQGDIVIGRSDKSPIALSDIDLDVVMQNEAFQPSLVSFSYEGTKAECKIEGACFEPDMQIRASIDGERLYQFLTAGQKLSPKFASYMFVFDTELKRYSNGWLAKGVLDFTHESIDTFDYRFFLNDTIATLNYETFEDIYRNCVSDGYFSAENVSLEASKFISHLQGDDWSLEGEVSFQGEFSFEKIRADISTAKYEFISSFGNVSHLGKSVEGSFTFDIQEGSVHGHLPIRSGVYLEKYMGVQYTDITAELFFEKEMLVISEITTEAKGLILDGEVSLNFANSEYPKLEIDIQKAVGTTKQLENFVSHIPGIKPLDLPFDGKIALDKGAFHLDCLLGKEEALWRTSLGVHHGRLKVPNMPEIYDMEFLVHYDSEEKECILSQFVGKVPTASNEREYFLRMPYLHLVDSEGVFDLSFDNGVVDLARFVGGFSTNACSVKLDESKSHLFSEPFSKAEFSFTKQKEPKEIDLTLAFALSELFRVKDLLADFSLIPLTLESTTTDPKHTNGKLQIALGFDNGSWRLRAEGNDITLGGYHSDVFTFIGEKVGSSLRVNHLQFQDFAIKSALLQTDDSFNVDLIKVDHPNMQFLCQAGTLDLRNKSLSLDLETALFEGEIFRKTPLKLSAEGSLEVQMLEEDPYLSLGASVNMQARGFGENGFSFKSSAPVTATYTSQEGLNIIDSDFTLLNSDAQEIATVHIPVASFLDEDFDLAVQGANLVVNNYELREELSAYLAVNSDEIMTTDQKSTECTLSFTLKDGHINASGDLPRADYVWKGHTALLDAAEFTYRPGKFTLGAQVPIGSLSYYMAADIDLGKSLETHIDVWPMLDKQRTDRSKRSLYVHCHLRDEDGIIIHRVSGEILGSKISLNPKYQMQDDRSCVLLGYVEFDAKQLYPILPKEVQEVVTSLNLHKGIGLRGEITLDKENLANSYFEGNLHAKDFDLLGYQVKSLMAGLHGSLNRIYLQNLEVSDDALCCHAKEIEFWERDKGDWHLRLPELTISDLRPSLLRKRGQSHQSLKPLHIKKMTLQELMGSITHSELITGKGSMSFVNTFKREPNLFDIPKEIISRIGLDPVLLVPIQGEMDYVLRDGKLLFTKLRNSYSESKRSYFYLWNKTDSYLDYSGNLHIDIRMKQHVLFKITQLFILSIEGSLEKPRFSLK